LYNIIISVIILRYAFILHLVVTPLTPIVVYATDQIHDDTLIQRFVLFRLHHNQDENDLYHFAICC